MRYPLINWKERIDRYIASLDRKAITKNSYRNTLYRFLDYLHSQNLIYPRKEDVVGYKEHLRESVGAATIQKMVVVLRGFFKDLSSLGAYPNIMENVRGEKIERTFKRSALTINETKRLLDRAHKLSSTIKGKRDYAIVSLIATSGLRTIEVERADKVDLSIKDETHILYIQGKGRNDKAEYVKVSDDVYRIIEDYLLSRSDESEALFVTHSRGYKGTRIRSYDVTALVKELLKGVGIDDPHYTAHSLRHSVATNLIKNGMSIEDTKLILRHKDISTTMIYVHSMNRESNNGEIIMSDLLFKGGRKKDE